ncbi:hypothetical protein FA10DRAFT_281710 [Acaromyces ingoldii]|uniref:CCHC-type domain-containing protein n=1 Tax=Acaromyces ingoldii TaxID=215250 RepID=A0A316YEB9_9BASI|nr:hypothetical protein FA10DRAFT_281710 [Acaromyces ingoldii]PWN87542.1 hypothetical protein FA10DRAFT_281710 [Acaromyces ingoldii]
MSPTHPPLPRSHAVMEYEGIATDDDNLMGEQNRRARALESQQAGPQRHQLEGAQPSPLPHQDKTTHTLGKRPREEAAHADKERSAPCRPEGNTQPSRGQGTGGQGTGGSRGAPNRNNPSRASGATSLEEGRDSQTASQTVNTIEKCERRQDNVDKKESSHSRMERDRRQTQLSVESGRFSASGPGAQRPTRGHGPLQHLTPAHAWLMRDGRRVVDICFATRLQAASFGQIDSFTVEMGGGKTSLTLRRWKSGVCHSRGLITMKVTPEVDRGDNPHRVERKAYKDAVSALLKAFPVLSFVGAWRQAVEWTNGTVQYQPVMLLVVRRPVGFLLHMLPGFVNTSGVPVRGCDEAPADAIWFHLQFGGRKSFCRYCKTAIHGPEECPKILCNTCHERGHIAVACPRGGRKAGRRGRNNGRGGRA